MAHALETEAIRQAVRWGSPQVHELHLLVALTATHLQLRDRGWHLREQLARPSNAGEVLRDHGVTYPDLARHAAAHHLGTTRSDRGRPWRRFPYDPPVGSDTVAAIDRASQLGRDLGHDDLGTGPVLLALLQEPDGDCVRVLEEAGIAVASLRHDLIRAWARG
jgi:hypothetical protein